jgi:AAA family ATP:ADP antiporter
MALSSGIYLALPALWSAALLTISDNSLSYSINQTSRETLYVPTSPDVKYKARAFANMFIQRAGKAVAIAIALALPFVPVRFLSLVAFPVVAAWIVLAVYAGRRFDALTEEAPASGRVEDVAAKVTA